MPEKINDGGPAFSRAGYAHPDYQCDRGEAADFSHGGNDGMSLRVYLAAKVLQAIIASDRFYNHTQEERVKAAYAYADAMLEASQK